MQIFLKPKKIFENSKIGLIAPSGYITEQQLEKAIKNVEKLSLKPIYTERILKKHGYLAGDDKNRLNDLEYMFDNKDIEAIFAIRGGVGATRLLSKIDYNLISQNPKIFLGYSDITALNYAFYKKANLISFHGVVAISEFTDFTIKSFNDLFFNNNKIIKYNSTDFERPINNSEFDLINLNNGIGEGEIIGGNLSLMTSLIGTKFDLDYKNKIVMLEEIDEYPYKIDRMITHLIQATNIAKASAIVLGIFKNCSIENKNVIPENSLDLQTIFAEHFKKLNIPIIYGFPFGHIKNQTIFPFGIKSKLDTYKEELFFLENIFSN